jgi:hypothetical protein
LRFYPLQWPLQTSLKPLLLDILLAFLHGGAERLHSRTLVAGLNSAGDRPWVELRKGREVGEIWLAQQLRPYGIRPKTMWIGAVAAKGYEREEFGEVFRRHIPRSEVEALKRMMEAGEGRADPAVEGPATECSTEGLQ